MTLTLANISLVNISNVQAATTDNTIKVSLDNIRYIVIGNNLDIKNSYNSNKIALQEYHDARDAYKNDSEPVESDYKTTTTTTDDSGTEITTTIVDTTAYNKAVNTYNTEKSTYETTMAAYKKAQTAYDQKVESVVYAAQDAYITYLANLSNEKLKEDKVNSNEKEEQVYKLQYENGFISKNEYTSKLQANTSINELNSLTDTVELSRTKLCNTLGISPEEKMTFDTNITENFEMISKINYENDLEQMLSNNVDIKLQNDQISDLEDEEDDYDDKDEENIYNYKLENENTTLKQLMNTAETDFKGQYNTLMNSYNSIKSSYDKLTEDEKSYTIMETKYNYGFASKKEVDDVKLTLDTERSTFNASKNTLYVDYLRYIQMKEGY